MNYKLPKCIKCNAPIKLINSEGKYQCDYCGITYYSNDSISNQSRNFLASTQKIKEQLSQVKQKVSRNIQKGTSRRNLIFKQWYLLPISLLGFVFLIGFFNGFKDNSLDNTNNENSSISGPSISSYQKSSNIYKGNPEAAKEYLNRLNDLFGVKGKEQESIKLANIALDLDKNSNRAYFYRGNAKNASGDHTGAISDYTKAIQLKPDFIVAYYNRGNTKIALKDYTGAISDFTKAIQLEPNDPDSYYNRGNAKIALKDYTGAISDYTKAIQLKPNDKSAYKNRGIAKEMINDSQGACSDYRKASRLGASKVAQLLKNTCD